MLLSFAVKNYRGFAQRIELDLTQPSNYTFNCDAIKDGVVKNGIVYGPNGSGKSNFSLAVFDIENHLSQKWKKPDYYSNFITAGHEAETVDFEYRFRFGDTVVEYMYSKDRSGRLTAEHLMADGETVFSHSVAGLEICSQFNIDAAAREKLLSNANGLSIVNYLTASYPLPQGHYLLALKEFVDSMLWFKSLDKREFIGLDNNSTFLEEEIIKLGLTSDFQKFLEEVSAQTFEFVQPNEGDKILKCVINGAVIPFSAIASTGTVSLQVLYIWLKKMDRASFVFIDEFDAFYHFRLAYEVCRRLFRLPCQVFVSSHNTYLMTNDLLRPDCNFILDHNVIKPLCDCTEKELRFGHNIEKLFRGNAFSAI